MDLIRARVSGLHTVLEKNLVPRFNTVFQQIQIDWFSKARNLHLCASHETQKAVAICNVSFLKVSKRPPKMNQKWVFKKYVIFMGFSRYFPFDLGG